MPTLEVRNLQERIFKNKVEKNEKRVYKKVSSEHGWGVLEDKTKQ